MCHLVILEKDAMQRALLENMVHRQAEYSVLSLPAEARSIQHIATNKRLHPEVVIFGLTSSEDYNLSLISVIKQLLHTVPILVVAEHTQNAAVTTMLRHGATHFLIKPFSSEHLVNALAHVRKMMLQMPQLRENYGNTIITGGTAELTTNNILYPDFSAHYVTHPPH